MVDSRVAVGVPIKPGLESVTEQDNTFSNQILILFSAPLLNEDLSPVENLSIQKEIDAIALVLEDIPQPIAVEIVLKVATSQTLQDVFASRVKPLIIHFIGHGMREGDSTALVLEDEVGMTRALSEEELKIALSNQKQAPCQLALLNACHSEKLAQAFVQAEVPHVIAVNAEDKILDMAAQCFSRRLYQALFNQDAVADSFLVSRNAVKLDDKLKKLFNQKTFQQGVNFDQAFKFELLPRTAHNQSLIIEPADSHQVIYPQWSNTNTPRNDPNFVGRRQEIHRVIKVLVESDNRCIALHGMGGMGKTALAYAIGRWLHERDRFWDGVWLISLRDTESVGTLITKIRQILELGSFALDRELRNSRILLILDDLDRLIDKEPNELFELLNSLLEHRLNVALAAAQRNQDNEGEDLVREKIAALASKGEFKDVQTLGQESAVSYTEDLGNGIELEMIAIPGGTFMMGSPEDEGRNNEKPQHEVTVQAFYMGKYPVTQAQYQEVMGKNPSYFQGDDQRPVECVSWDDAVEFCQRLSKQTGTEYRLPTEAEWEYACRAETTTPYYFGDNITSDLANYGGNVGQTTAVGKYPPNVFGLYDMHGNVWEWCQDDWHGDYKNAPTDGSAWVLAQRSLRVIHGGSCFNYPDFCRSAFRFGYAHDIRDYFFGFRVSCAAFKTT